MKNKNYTNAFLIVLGAILLAELMLSGIKIYKEQTITINHIILLSLYLISLILIAMISIKERIIFIKGSENKMWYEIIMALFMIAAGEFTLTAFKYLPKYTSRPHWIYLSLALILAIEVNFYMFSLRKIIPIRKNG